MRLLAWWVTMVVTSVAAVAYLALDPLAGFPWSVAGWASFVVGAVLSRKVPSNPTGWLLLGFGSVGAIATLLLAGAWWEWVETAHLVLGVPAVLILAIVLIRFPDGTLGTSKMRALEFLAVATAALGVFAALFNGGWTAGAGRALAPSPLYESTRPLGDVLSQVFFPLFALVFALAGISLIVRYRRSSGKRRLQFKWLAYAAALLVAGVILLFAATGFDLAAQQLWHEALMASGLAAIPVAIGIAVLQYRLFDIDVVIGRTVVFGVLAVFITATYALIVVGLARLIGSGSDGLVLPIVAIATVAVAFEPVRLRAQRWANRLVYGTRATPYEVLGDITERMSVAETGEGILARLASLLRDGTGADRVTVWLGEPSDMIAASTSGTGLVPTQPDLSSDNVFTVTHDDQVVGALEVVKPRGTAFSTAERSLVSDLAGSAGAVLGYQRLNDSLERRARELEESRARLVSVQDEERRRLERDLHEGAEQFIVALKVKLGVATQVASRHEAGGLHELLVGLNDEARAALDDVQSLAKGIYPPVLQSDGLGVAVSALASSTAVEVQVEPNGVGRYPPEVEAAVYFDISEAVTNAVKHAQPPIRIVMAEEGGLLTFSVVDNGPGFDIDESDKGSGLENMVDRLHSVGGDLEVRSERGGRTEVLGRIPV